MLLLCYFLHLIQLVALSKSRGIFYLLLAGNDMKLLVANSELKSTDEIFIFQHFAKTDYLIKILVKWQFVYFAQLVYAFLDTRA